MKTCFIESPLKSSTKLLEASLIFKIVLIWLLYSFREQFPNHLDGLLNPGVEQRGFSTKNVITTEYCIVKVNVDGCIVSQNNLFNPNLSRLYWRSFSGATGRGGIKLPLSKTR